MQDNYHITKSTTFKCRNSIEIFLNFKDSIDHKNLLGTQLKVSKFIIDLKQN